MTFFKTTIVALAVTALPILAHADNPHFVSGPTVSCSGAALNVSFKVAGLGSVSNVTGSLTGNAQEQCINRGGNTPPGHEDRLSTSENFPVRNGNTSGSLTLVPLDICPGPMKLQVTYTDLILTVDGLTSQLSDVTCSE